MIFRSPSAVDKSPSSAARILSLPASLLLIRSAAATSLTVRPSPNNSAARINIGGLRSEKDQRIRCCPSASKVSSRASNGMAPVAPTRLRNFQSALIAPRPTSAKRHPAAVSARFTMATSDPNSAGCKCHDGRTSDSGCARPSHRSRCGSPVG